MVADGLIDFAARGSHERGARAREREPARDGATVCVSLTRIQKVSELPRSRIWTMDECSGKPPIDREVLYMSARSSKSDRNSFRPVATFNGILNGIPTLTGLCGSRLARSWPRRWYAAIKCNARAVSAPDEPEKEWCPFLKNRFPTLFIFHQKAHPSFQRRKKGDISKSFAPSARA